MSEFDGKFDDRNTALITALYGQQARLRNERDQLKKLVVANYPQPPHVFYEYKKDWHKTEIATLEARVKELEAILSAWIDCWEPEKVSAIYTQYNLKTDPEGQRGLYESKFLSCLFKARTALTKDVTQS